MSRQLGDAMSKRGRPLPGGEAQPQPDQRRGPQAARGLGWQREGGSSMRWLCHPAAKPVPEGYHTLTPYLVVDGAAAAIAFYQKAFGATERLRMNKTDGRIGHAEIQIGDSVVMLADEHPEISAFSPGHYGGATVSFVISRQLGDAMSKCGRPLPGSEAQPQPDQREGGSSMRWLCHYVADCDALYRGALAAGAGSQREPADQPYGDRMAGVRDPFGYTWWLATHIRDVPAEELAKMG